MRYGDAKQIGQLLQQIFAINGGGLREIADERDRSGFRHKSDDGCGEADRRRTLRQLQ